MRFVAVRQCERHPSSVAYGDTFSSPETATPLSAKRTFPLTGESPKGGRLAKSCADFGCYRRDDVGIVPYDITIGNIVGRAALCAPSSPIADATRRTVGEKVNCRKAAREAALGCDGPYDNTTHTSLPFTCQTKGPSPLQQPFSLRLFQSPMTTSLGTSSITMPP